LKNHLSSLPGQPEAIPYITSYYSEFLGICVSETQRQSLTDAHYQVVIDSTLEDGNLTYAELVLPGECEKECPFRNES